MRTILQCIVAVVAGFVAASAVMMALVLGVLLTSAGIANNLMRPPPNWFWIVTFGAFLPATFVGARLVPRRATAAGRV
jgi:hypothetical protein